MAIGNQTVRRIGGLGDKRPGNQQVMRGVSTLVDIVFLIDGTGSMQNLLDGLKERALSLHQEIIEGLKDKNRRVTKMRVKVLVFRDLYVDANAFEESEFYTLPEEAGEFRSFISSIKACGGGDEPESSLEALYKAMTEFKYQENFGEYKARQILIMMTDASAHKLDDPQRDGDDLYPQNMPRSIGGVENAWAGMDHRAKRLIVMGPNVWPWTTMTGWESTQVVPAPAGKGIDEEGLKTVIEFTSGSI